MTPSTELSFLIELLLEHKLPAQTKQFIKARIRAVEQNLNCHVTFVPGEPFIIHEAVEKPAAIPVLKDDKGNPLPPQAPSTTAKLAKHAGFTLTTVESPPPPEPVAVIAQTPAAVAAMQSRQQAINEALSGKVNKDTGRPRKF